MSLLPITVLRRARKLIADRKSWIKGAFIGKREGAQCYCGLGALATAAGIKVIDGNTLSRELKLPNEYYEAHALLNKASNAQWNFFAYFNDDKKTTHADVLAAFDRAIAAAKAG